MKVDISEPKPAFKPVTITLETKEELELVWHFFNTPADYFKEYIHFNKVATLIVSGDGLLSRWETLNKVCESQGFNFPSEDK